MRKIKIAPSILAADQSNLKAAVEDVERAGADMIHVDVADGHFAPNISMGPDTVRALRNVTRLPLDVHLMIEQPGKFLDTFLEAGSDIVTVHSEVVNMTEIREYSRAVHSKGRRLGLALRPETQLPSWFKTQSDDLDLLLLLSVNPGFAGQKFMPSVLSKLQEALTMLDGRADFEIEVDGGVDTANASQIVEKGATILVAGASIFRRGNVKLAIHQIRELVDGYGTREVTV